MKNILYIGLIGFVASCSNGPSLKCENDSYNYSVIFDSPMDSGSSAASNSNDSVLLQFGGGFSDNTLKLITDNNEYKEIILSEDETQGYSGYLKLSNETKEIKFNVNNGPIIFIPIRSKKIFYVWKKSNTIEVLGLKQPAKFK